jgi:hypothetical protein
MPVKVVVWVMPTLGFHKQAPHITNISMWTIPEQTQRNFKVAPNRSVACHSLPGEASIVLKRDYRDHRLIPALKTIMG